MTTAVIIQARIHSSRLPKKILKEINGKPVLEYFLERANAIPHINSVCCATVDSSECDPIVNIAEQFDVAVYKGSEENVLERYYYAAKLLDADTIVRITSDCPLIDPWVCGQTLSLFTENDADYACNNMPRTWPHGLDCEVFRFSWLEKAFNEAKTQNEQEHVTPFIRNHPRTKKVNLDSPDATLATHRWTLDYPEDFEFLSKIIPKLPIGEQGWHYEEVLKILEDNPDFITINKKYAEN